MAFELPSKRLILSYVFDWVVIVAIAAVGGAWNSIVPYHRPFSVTDLSISFPYQDELIKTWILIVVGLVAPAIIIFLVCLLLVPGRSSARNASRSLVWRRKLWEWNAGWMGLALSLATAFMLTQGLKVIFGKHRPDLLSRCMPSLSAASIREHAVGSYAAGFNPEWVLVDSGICTQKDSSMLDDGFKSFPSGHASFSWAGLLYLSLFLCAKFAIAIPFLPPRPHSTDPAHTVLELERDPILPVHCSDSTSQVRLESNGRSHPANIIPIRSQAAAPPVWTLVLAIIPICVALYICSTRYAQYRHFGFDIIGGAVIGITSAWVGFRWYHLPIRQGAGWAWAARTRDRAFAVGVGTLGYVGREGWGPSR